MEVVINDFAKEKLDSKNLKDQYIKAYYMGVGWSAGIQMEFDKRIGIEYEVYEVDGYKIGVNRHLFDDYDYIEIKYSDNFLQQGFYASILRPEE